MNFFIVMFLLAGILFAGCRSSSERVPAVSGFDAARYCGKWYEIARLPNWFQRGITNASAEYTLLKNGEIRVVNRGVTASGKEKRVTGTARLVPARGDGELEVSFQKPFRGRYRVIWLNKDYTIAVVCGGNMDHLWILAREKTIPPAVREKIVDFLKQSGFAVEKLLFSGGQRGE